MSSEDTAATADANITDSATEAQVTFKVKTSSDGNHSITMAESATVLDLKKKLSGDDYEKIAVDRMRLIYSGRVMKDPEPLSTYKIKQGNTVHMVKNAASNAGPAAASSPAVPAVPTNMAAGTANNPLAGLTGARYAGHMGLPGADMFGADGGMGAPPNEDQIASMLDDPNIRQTMNEALNNPAMIDMMMQQIPGLRDDPNARAMFQSPEFRQMMTNPDALRQAAAMRRMMGGGGGGAGGFPAPGVTDTTPTTAGQTGSTPAPAPAFNPFLAQGGANAGNPFSALFGQPSQTPAQTPPPPASAGGAGTPSINPDPAAANPFASLFGTPATGAPGAGGAQNPFQIPGMPPITPEMLQQAQQMLNNGQLNHMFGGQNPYAAFGGGAPGGVSSPPPADTRPPEEIYADQLRQLNDMGFYEFDRNVAALRRAGGSVQGAIEQLLNS